MNKIYKSPLKDRPLNVAGQSGDSKLHDFLLDNFLSPLLFVMALLVATMWEWVAYVRQIPRNPNLFSAISFATAVAVAFYWRFRWAEFQRIKLGRDGERAVGQFLDRYAEADATVFHDVPTGQGNIDHVIICSRGVFTIETKTRSKPKNAVVVVEDNQLIVGGYAPDRNPITQSLGCASFLRQFLSESTGKKFDVRAVVVFPGWFIEDKRPSGSPVWVLEPKALPAWIAREKGCMSISDVSLASYHLSRYIRTFKPSR